MRAILFLIYFFFISTAKSQSNGAINSSVHRDSVINALSNRLSVTQQKASSLLATIDSSFIKIQGIAGDRGLTREQKTTFISAVTAIRDSQIANLLTTEQISKLKVFMAENRTRRTGN